MDSREKSAIFKGFLLILLILAMISSVNASDVYINQGDDWQFKLDNAGSNDNIIFNNTKIESFTYTSTKPFNISGVNSTLVGKSGRYSIWQFDSSSTGSVIQNLNLVNSSFCGIYINGVSNITIKNCTIDNPYNNGIDIVGNSKKITIDNVSITNLITGIDCAGIWVDNSDNVMINKLFVFNSTYWGIGFNNSMNINLINSRIENCTDNGIWIAKSSFISMKNITITGVNNSGIWIEDNSYNITINLVNISDNPLNNSPSSNSAGIYAVGVLNLTINNTIISNNGGSGINISGYNNTIVSNKIYGNSGNGVVITGNNSTFKDNNVTKNGGYGFLISGNDNNITGSNVIDNQDIGFYITGLDNLINYNRILDNTNFDLFNTGTGNNANFNWWGFNAGPIFSNSGSITLGNWFVMILSGNDVNMTDINFTDNFIPGNYNLAYQLLLYTPFTGDLEVDILIDNLPDFLVNLTCFDKTGTVIFNLKNVNGKGVYSYIVPLSRNGNFTLEAVGDNQDIIFNIHGDLLVGEANLTLTKTVNVTGTVFKGQTVIYTITIKNNGPDDAYNVLINELLGNPLVFISSNPSKGSYDSIGGKWFVGNLYNGKTATLRIIALVNGIGDITNYVDVISNDINTGNLDTKVKISAKIQTKPDSANNTTKNKNNDTLKPKPKKLPDLYITGVKKVNGIYKVTIKNIGKTTSKVSLLKLYCGCKKYSKIVKVKGIKNGKKVTISVKFPKKHLKHFKYGKINYNKKIIESNYKNNLFKIGKR